MGYKILNNTIYGINKASAYWFDLLNTGIEKGVITNVKFTLVYFTEDTQSFKPMMMIM